MHKPKCQEIDAYDWFCGPGSHMRLILLATGAAAREDAECRPLSVWWWATGRWVRHASSSPTPPTPFPRSTSPPCSTTTALRWAWTAERSASTCGTRRARRSTTACARSPTRRPTSSSSASPSAAPRPSPTCGTSGTPRCRTTAPACPSCWWAPSGTCVRTRRRWRSWRSRAWHPPLTSRAALWPSRSAPSSTWSALRCCRRECGRCSWMPCAQCSTPLPKRMPRSVCSYSRPWLEMNS